MPLRTTAPAVVVLTALLSGCSGDGDDCAGTSYDVDLSEEGSRDTIGALNAWLDGPTGFDQLPADDSWIVTGSPPADAEAVVLRSDDGEGWWVHVVRTDHGGYVVDQATNDWTSCEDELS